MFHIKIPWLFTFLGYKNSSSLFFQHKFCKMWLLAHLEKKRFFFFLLLMKILLCGRFEKNFLVTLLIEMKRKNKMNSLSLNWRERESLNDVRTITLAVVIWTPGAEVHRGSFTRAPLRFVTTLMRTGWETPPMKRDWPANLTRCVLPRQFWFLS